jgi:hypothetical protein
MSVTIDVHRHILPDFFWRETYDAHHPVGGGTPLPWDAGMALSIMDEAGIDIAVTSISTPGVRVGDDARARSLADATSSRRNLCEIHPTPWRADNRSSTR